MRPSFTALALVAVLAACSAPDRGQLNIDDDAAATVDTGGSPDDMGGTTPDAQGPPDVPVVSDVAVADVPGVVDVSVPEDVPVAPRCGDGTCTMPREDCTNCPRDCGACPARCGDGECTAPRENCMNCPRDCGVCDGCNVASTCDTCTPMNNCGWCRNSGHCLTGTTTGPTDRSCTTAQWAWTMNQCAAPVDPCNAFTNCNLCAGQATCGWCANLNRCLTGTTAGPNNGACRGVDWRPMPATCGGGG